MAGIPAGRLSIEIVAEIARLQQDLDKAKRAVNAASADIARSARAANDNLAGIGKGAGAGVQQYSRDVAALKAALDPAWAAMQKYRQEVALAQKALSQGAITQAQFVDAVRMAATSAGLLADKEKEAAAAAATAAQAEREAAQAAEAAARKREAAAAAASNYAAKLQAEAAAIGKTSAELRAMEVEQRAVAAAAAGLGAEADQIRAAGAAYAEAATKAEKEAQATRDAAAAHEAFEARVREGVAALRERAALVASAESYAGKLEAEAAAVGKTAAELRELEIAQRAANAAAAGMPDQADRIRAAGAALAEAEAQAAAFAEEQKRVAAAAREAADAEADYVKSIEELRKQANPAGAAQEHLNSQMVLAEKAFRDGRLAADEYAQIIHNLQTRLNFLGDNGFDPLSESSKVAGHHMLNLSFQMQDLGVQLLGAAQSSAPLKLAFTALIQQGSQIYGVIQQSGLGFKAFAAQALVAAGIIKISGDEALIAAARQAVAHEAVVASLAERAAANVATAEAEVALAQAQVRNAATAIEAAAAQLRLAAGQEAAAAAAAEATTAQAALARAQASSATATDAANASMITRLGAVGRAAVPVVAVLAAATAAFALFDRAISQGIDTKAMVNGLGLTRDEIKKLENTSITSGDVIKATFQVMAERAGISFSGLSKAWGSALDWMTDVARSAMANIYANTVGTFKAVWAAVMALKSGKGLGGAWDAAADAYTGAQKDANQYLTKLGKDIRDRAAANKKADLERQAAAIKADRTPRSDKTGESLARELESTEALISGLYRAAEAYRVSTAAGIRARVEAEATAKGIKKQADVQAYANLQLRKYVAEQVVGSAEQVAAMTDQTRAQEFVNKAVRDGALDADKASQALSDITEQQKLMTTMTVAQLNKDKEGYDAAKKALADLTAAQLANNKSRTEAIDLQQKAQVQRSIEDIELETKLMKDLGEARVNALRGLSGGTLEDELARIAAQHEKIAIAAKADLDANRALALGQKETAAIIRDRAKADMAQVDVRMEIDKGTVAIERYNDSLRDTVGLLGDLGSVGQGLAAILGVITGNTGAVRGPLGDILNLGMTGKDGASTIGDELSKVFKKDGLFAKTITPIFQSASIGMAASSALMGKQSATEQAGSVLGGALGGKLGDKLGKTLAASSSKLLQGLGDFAGPLGSIAGGVIGNVLGGMLKKVKWGRVDLSSAGVSGTSGNSSAAEKAALAAGDSIFGSLTDLATKLGGAVGNFGNISVGVRHGDYRVNTGGTSLKKDKGAVDFDDDAEAAVAYAIKQAIERGAITGIRQSTNNLLKAGDDLQAQLTKAMSFEGVFSELKSITDPVGAAIDDVEKQFTQLRAIFAEAGATAQEYAQLEQLLTIKRQEALDKEQDALNDIKSRIAEAQGDQRTVTAIARAKELKAATSAAQRAELQRLYAIEDAKAAQDKLTDAQNAATAAADQLRQAWESVGDSIKDEIDRIRGLTGGDDGASFAMLQGRFNATVTAARGGDKDAAGKLVDLSQSLIEAAGNTATSRQELERIKAETARQLEGVYDRIASLAAGSTSPSATATSAAAASNDTPSGTNANDASATELRTLRAELAQMRADMNSGNATIASNTGRIAKKLDDVTSASGGDAIAVASAA